MQREFGGYLPLELPHGQELYTGAGVLRLNCGRNAIVAALRDAGAKKVYLPYYNCNTVYDAVTRAGFAVERYPLDARRLPVCPALGDGEWLLYVNYFGIASDDLLAEVKRRWPRVIFDNTQAFFSAPRMHQLNPPQSCKYLLELLPADSVEADYSRYLLPLPIDQRYTPDDMRALAALVLQLKEEGEPA